MSIEYHDWRDTNDRWSDFFGMFRSTENLRRLAESTGKIAYVAVLTPVSPGKARLLEYYEYPEGMRACQLSHSPFEGVAVGDLIRA